MSRSAGVAHRPLRADHARGRAARRHRRPAVRLRGLRPAAARTAAATASWPAPAGCWTRWRTSASTPTTSSSCATRASSTSRPPAWLADYRFRGDIDGYAEGELYFPGSPDPHRRPAPSPSACCWRPSSCRSSTTTARSPPPRPGWSPRPGGRPLIEMGSRRTHEQAAVAAARAAYLGRLRLDLQPRGRYALRHPDRRHQRARLHPAARRRAAGVRRPGRRAGPAAPRCWSTPTTSPRAVRNGDRGGRPRARRGPHRLRRPVGAGPAVRALLDELGATEHQDRRHRRPRRVRHRRPRRGTGRRLRGRHSLVTGSGRAHRRPGLQAGRSGRRPVVKRSENKATVGGRKTAVRRHKPTGTAVEEVVVPTDARPQPHDRLLQRGVGMPAGHVARATVADPGPRAPAHRVDLHPLGGVDAVRWRTRPRP